MKYTKTFFQLSGVIMLVASIIRFSILFQDTHISRLLLKDHDPLFGLVIRYEVWSVAIIELVAAAIFFFGKNRNSQSILLAWLMTNYFVYRFGFFWLNFKFQRSCFGSLSDPLHVSQGLVGLLTKQLPYLLAIGSCGSLVCLWLNREKRQISKQNLGQPIQDDGFKMICAACGGHIRFSEDNLGSTSFCPHCQAKIALTKTQIIKFSCYFCKQHIEFPSHALGQKISCPRCEKEITLMEPK